MHNQVTADMLSVEEARDKILALVSVLEEEECPLLDTIGQVLAQDIISSIDVPPLDNSAMDGYAVRYKDVKGATFNSPKELQIAGLLAAGQLAYQEVKSGTAIRIMTGAPIPPGADTVVPFEETDEEERKSAGYSLDSVSIRKEVPWGFSVRSAGEDIRKGDLVLPKGVILRPSELGVLASLGYQRIPVIRRPVVAILATGEELLEPGQKASLGKIYDSNSYSVAASVLRCGGIPKMLGIAHDTPESINLKLDKGLEADLVITSAGVSKGDYDIVKYLLTQRGEIAFWSVRMRPAKPLAFGMLRGAGNKEIPLLGLPGNPVSAMVAFEVLGRCAILKMMGRSNLERPIIEAVLEDKLSNHDGRRVYARAIIKNRNGIYYAKLTGPQGSNLLTSMTRANGLAICPENIQVLDVGERVKVRMLDWNEETI